jgi:hypothetical protein
VLIGVGFNLVWRSITSNQALLKPEVSEETINKITKNYWLGIPLYGVATLGAFINVYVTIGICTALWIFYAATTRDL